MAKSSPIAEAFVQIKPTTDGIGQMLNKELSGSMSEAGSFAGKTFAKSMLGFVAKLGIGALITKTISKGISLGAELEQNLGGTEAVFGEFAKNIQEQAQESYKNMGLSASDYMATANKMASLFQGSGLSQQQALDLTTKGMQRAADVASIMGIETSAAMEAIAGAAKNNFTMMDNLGVAMNATTIQAYALEKGINFNWNTASQAEKSQLALEMFLDKTKNYAGNFRKETESSFSGAFGAMKSSFQDLLANLFAGQDIKSSIKAFLGSAENFLINGAGKMISNVLGSLASLMPSLLSNFFSSLPALADMSAFLLEQSGSFVDKGIELVMNLVQGLVDGLPLLIEYAPTIISNIANIINENMPKILKAGFDIILTLGLGLIRNIPNILANMNQILMAVIDVIKAINWLNIGSNIIKLMADGVKGLFHKIPDIMEEIVNSIKVVFKIDWGKIGSDIIGGIASGISNAVKGLVDIAIKACGQLVDGVKSFFGIHSPSRLMANQVGKFIPEGIALGIEKNMSSVQSAMDEVNDLVLSSANSDIAYRAVITGNHYAKGMGEAGSGATTIHQTVNNYSPKELSPSEVARLTRNSTRQLLLAMEGN